MEGVSWLGLQGEGLREGGEPGCEGAEGEQLVLGYAGVGWNSYGCALEGLG